MSKRRPVITTDIRVRVYPVLQAAVDTGVSYGWHHAHKHDEQPDEAVIKNEIYKSVMSELCERLIWDDSEE